MNTTKSLLAVCGLALALTPAYALAAPNHAHADAAPQATAAPAPVAAPKLQAALRSLWHGHVVNTREYAFAMKAGDSKRAAHAADAVVANAHQLADAVGSYYGKPAGDQMMTLLAGHWGAVKALTDAGQRHDKAASTKAMDDLTKNAGEISVFLAGANPYLPADAVRGLLLAHGAHHAAQIDEIMSGNLKAEQTTWTAMQAHMDVIADAMAAAIAKQFPDKAA